MSGSTTGGAKGRCSFARFVPRRTQPLLAATAATAGFRLGLFRPGQEPASLGRPGFRTDNLGRPGFRADNLGRARRFAVANKSLLHPRADRCTFLHLAWRGGTRGTRRRRFASARFGCRSQTRRQRVAKRSDPARMTGAGGAPPARRWTTPKNLGHIGYADNHPSRSRPVRAVPTATMMRIEVATNVEYVVVYPIHIVAANTRTVDN